MKANAFRLITLAALLALGTHDLSAQVTTRQRRTTQQRGWLGFAYEPVTIGTGDARRPAIVVGDVVEDSPAERAGVQVGDTVLTINQIRVTEQFMSSLAVSLVPGDNVRLRILRDGSERDISVQAAERPEEYAVEPTWPQVWTYEVRPDSIRERVRLYLDSALVVLDTLRLPRIRVERTPEGGVWMFHDSTRFQLLPGDSTWQRLRGDARWLWADSLRLRTDSVWQRVAPRVRAFSLRDDSLLRLRTDSMFRRFAPSGRAFEFADSTLGLYLRRFDSLPRGQIFGFSGDSLFAFRPGTGGFGIAVLGMRAIGGAQLTELNSELGEYFGAESGVLVLEVPEETPAARAGLEAGDVILSVNDTEVSTVAELRRAIGTRNRPIRIEVLRRNERRTIELRED